MLYAVIKAAAKRGWSTLGIRGGFEGLLAPGQTRRLDYREMDGLLHPGGTVFSTSNSGRFAAKVGHGEARRIDPAILPEAKKNFDALGLGALIVVGGGG